MADGDDTTFQGTGHPAGRHRRARQGRLRRLWVDKLGLEVTGTFVSERENVDEDICALGSGPFKVEVDLMQPLDPEGKKPAVHATPLNHVGLWIDDLPAAVQLALGAKVCALRPGAFARGQRVSTSAFCTPRQRGSSRSAGEGVLIELVQAPPEVVAAFGKLMSSDRHRLLC
jgi:lactoylglutathione lyase